MRFHARFLLPLVLVAALTSAVASAQTPLLSEVRTITGTTAAPPVERELNIAAAGTYELMLTDLSLPALFTSLDVAVTRGSEIAASASTAAGVTSKSVRFEATAGGYVVRLVGVPAASKGAGTAGVKISRVSDSGVALELVEPLVSSAVGTPPNQAILDTTLELAEAGTYEVTLTDLALPAGLTQAILALTPVGGAAPIATLSASGATTFTAAAGSYKLVAAADSPVEISAGLFSVTVRLIATNKVVYGSVTPVGNVARLASVPLAAKSYTLSFMDFGVPAALAQQGALLYRAGEPEVRVTSGSQQFMAVAGDYELFTVAAPASAVGAGSYGVEVRPDTGAAVFSAVKTVNSSTAMKPGFTFPVDITTAGDYLLKVTDLQFPAALAAQGLQFAAFMDGVSIGAPAQSGAPDILDLKALPVGRLFIVVAAKPTAQAGGVFGIELSSGAQNNIIFETTQGVGALFGVRRLTVAAGGTYRVTVQDIAFPAKLGEFSALVTRGSTRLGSIFGGGSFDVSLTPGNYFINFLAVPAAGKDSGTYSLVVADKPASPTVTLSSSAAQVENGRTVTLTWSSQNATACTASGGWSGARATSGSDASPAITASTTFTLTCEGPGGSANAAVTVSPAAAAASGGGGGGNLGWLAVLGLLGAVARRSRTLLA